MARCTAPIYGHRTASGRANCPVCGNGYGNYYSSYPSYPFYSSYSASSSNLKSGSGGSNTSSKHNKTKGYVYYLAKKKFVHAMGSQWVCYDEIVPDYIKEIDVNDYLDYCIIEE